MYLRPSNIYYSQDSINNVFDKRCNHSYKPIGETLDEICEGRCSVNDIPTISVVQRNGNWVTADNRRLWVFRQLERLGKCDKVFVQKGFYIPEAKLTSENDGVTVRVRGSPGGHWYLKRTPTRSTNSPENSSFKYIYNLQSQGTSAQNVISNTLSTAGKIRSTSGTQKVISYTPSAPGHNRLIKPASSLCDNEEDFQGSFNGSSDHHYYRQNESSVRLLPEQRVFRHKTYDISNTSHERLYRRNDGSYRSKKLDDGCCIII